KFKNAETKLREEGYEVINPAKVGLLMPKSFEHKDYMDIDFALMQKCEAIYLLKGWRASIGSVNELSFARQRGMKIIYE
ncbi:MAG: DUF4406 domain-containing protein, partial [Lachnospiraceae bacterium]|nr:DUF4406 domain-containing protein [Lachnospiraceae bacterium]